MARKKLVYTTDKGRRYLVSLDAALGDVLSLGFTIATENEQKELDALPRNITMRNYVCASKNPPVNTQSIYRQFAIGLPTASILTVSADFGYKGITYTPRRYHPEKRRK